MTVSKTRKSFWAVVDTPEEKEINPTDELNITPQIRWNMLKSMRWLKFLVIVISMTVSVLVFVGLVMVLEPLLMGFKKNDILSFIVGILYLIMMGFYIYPLDKAFTFIKDTRKAMDGDQLCLAQASQDFLTIVKYLGYLTAIELVIYVPLLLYSLIVGIVYDVY